MNKIIILAFTALLSLAAIAQTQPVYITQTASGTTTAAVCFASSPLQQIRLVSAIATSDLAGSTLCFRTGVTPHTAAYTNGATTKSFGVASTNGFSVGDWILIETAAGLWTNGIITGFTTNTNVICQMNLIATVPGDQIYNLSAATSLPIGATTATYGSEAIYVGNRGRPVFVYANGTSSITLNGITARYE